MDQIEQALTKAIEVWDRVRDRGEQRRTFSAGFRAGWAARPERPTVLRRDVREHLEKTRKYWTGPENRASTGALADEVIKFLHEQGIAVRDDDWSG